MRLWCNNCEVVIREELSRCPRCGTPLVKASGFPRKAWPGRPPGMKRPRRADNQKPL